MEQDHLQQINQMYNGGKFNWYNTDEDEHGSVYRDDNYLIMDSGTGGKLKFMIAGTQEILIEAKEENKKEFTIDDPYDFSEDDGDNDIKENGYDEITDIAPVQSEIEPDLTETEIEEQSTSKNLFDKNSCRSSHIKIQT